MHIAVGDKPTKRPNFLNLLMGSSIYNALPGKPMRDCIDSLEVRKKPGGHWIIRDLAGLDLVGLASL